jgi:hypothetical protein
MDAAYFVITLITATITAAAVADFIPARFFVGAVVTHLRAHVLHNIAFPGAYLCPSAATLALMVGR